MKDVVVLIALSVCSPIVVIGMLVLEPIHIARKKLTRRKVHPIGAVTDSNLARTAL